MDLPFLVYEGVFKMKKKDFAKLTLKEKADLVKQYGYLVEFSCSSQECETCPFSPNSYTNVPKVVFRGRRMPCGKIYDMFVREVGR